METEKLELELERIYGESVKLDEGGVYTETGDHFWDFTVGSSTGTAQFFFDGDECSACFPFSADEEINVTFILSAVIKEKIPC